MVTTQVVTRMVCPAELDQTPPTAPSVADDAKITANASGQAYLAGLVVWGQSLIKLFNDAASDCHAQVAAQAPIGVTPVESETAGPMPAVKP